MTQCFNLGPEQNKMNMEECERLGIADKVTTHVGNLNDPLPEEWTGRFDFVWSCEVFCHAADKPALLKEIARVLKPGGVLVFSDLMGADKADEKQLRAFTDRNATTSMGRPAQYLAAIEEAQGLDYMMWCVPSLGWEMVSVRAARKSSSRTNSVLPKTLSSATIKSPLGVRQSERSSTGRRFTL